MGDPKKIVQKQDSFLDSIYKQPLLSMAAVFGAIATVIITSVNCLINYLVHDSLSLSNVVMPLAYGAVLTSSLVFFLSKMFSEVEKSRRQVLDLQKQETQLKTSLAKSYIAMINQREKNNTLSQDHEKLRGTLDNEITQRLQAQNLLDEQLVFFSAIVDLTPDIILYRNSSGEIKGCNDNLLRLLRIKDSEQLNQLLMQDQKLNECFVHGDNIVISNKTDIMYERTINNIIYQIRKRPAVNPKGQLIGTMIYGHDITKLKNEQDVLEKASRDKSNFISTLSHELRTPLNGIVGLSDILLGTGHFSGEDVRNLKAINVSAVTLGNIFNDVIDLNKFERQTFSINMEDVKWKEFIEDLETLSRLMTEQKNLSFDFKVEGTVPEVLKTDPTRLRQMLWNIISNAIKFTSKGGISIVIEHVQGAEHCVHVNFKIKDTGIGIAKDQQQKIFGLYYQVPGTKQSTGTGIGLNVTKQLASVMGGRIHLESELGAGSLFTLSFDFLEIIPKKQDEVRRVLTSLNILLVEDVDLNILVCKTMLEKLGNRVVAAKTGKDALELYQKEQPDLVLLDMQLPDMTGLDVADHLVNDFQCTKPVLALTANVMQDPSVYTAHHIDGALSKPLSATKLAEKIKNYALQKENRH